MASLFAFVVYPPFPIDGAPFRVILKAVLPVFLMEWVMRRAFTLVELLVSVATMAMLFALLLPAVQAARRAAREAQCRSNLHQFGLYIEQHTDRRGRMPAINPRGPIELLCPETLEVVDAPWMAIYQQRFHGSTREFAMEAKGLASSEIPIVLDARPVHDGDLNVLFLDQHVGRWVEPPVVYVPDEEESEE